MEQSVDSNRFYDDRVGFLTLAGLKTSIRSNLFSTNETGLYDLIDAKDAIGGSGAGNTFVRSGIGMAISSVYLGPVQDTSAGMSKGSLSQSSFDAPLSDPQGQAEYSAATGIEPKPIDPSILELISNLGKGDVIQGNYIGTDAQGKSGLGNQIGAEIFDSVTGAQFGGTAKGDGNTVRANGNAGLLITGPSSHPPTVAVLGDTFFGDGLHPGSDKPISRLGLDLVTFTSGSNTLSGHGFGPDRLDPSQPGAGTNHLQNYPVLTAASAKGTAVAVTGVLDSAPNTAYTIQLFASPACSPSGFGEGEKLIDTLTVHTTSTGKASFTGGGAAANGQFITATATNAGTLTTSEFSRCVQVK